MGGSIQSTRTKVLKAQLWILMLCVVGTGCAHQDVKVAGEWRPANALDATPQPIQEVPTVHYIATPLDRSLRMLLSRWCTQGEVLLNYEAKSDFSLSVDAAAIRATSLEGAVDALNRIYATSGVEIQIEGSVVTVVNRAPIQVKPATGRSKRKNKR